jgi:hypothetical protein
MFSRGFGVLGIVVSVLFLMALLFAIGSRGGISKEEFAVVAYFFAMFAVIMCVSAMRMHGASTRVAGTVLGLALLYMGLYTVEWAASDNQSFRESYDSGSYRVNSDDWNVAAAVPLSGAVIALGWSLARRRTPRFSSTSVAPTV